jgi:hypothetical protein
MNLNKKLIIEILVALGIVLLVSVGGYLAYKYYSSDTETADNSQQTEVKKCEELELITPEGAPAPVAHVLSSKLNENADDNSDICTWNVNGQLSHTSFPVKGKCLFGDQVFDKAGTYNIELVVEKNKCNLSKEVVVN